MSSLFIVIPAYNESENIEQTIRDWYPIVESHNEEGKSRLVIINDGSKDNIKYTRNSYLTNTIIFEIHHN